MWEQCEEKPGKCREISRKESRCFCCAGSCSHYRYRSLGSRSPQHGLCKCLPPTQHCVWLMCSKGCVDRFNCSSPLLSLALVVVAACLHSSNPFGSKKENSKEIKLRERFTWALKSMQKHRRQEAHLKWSKGYKKSGFFLCVVGPTWVWKAIWLIACVYICMSTSVWYQFEAYGHIFAFISTKISSAFV